MNRALKNIRSRTFSVHSSIWDTFKDIKSNKSSKFLRFFFFQFILFSNESLMLVIKNKSTELVCSAFLHTWISWIVLEQSQVLALRYFTHASSLLHTIMQFFLRKCSLQVKASWMNLRTGTQPREEIAAFVICSSCMWCSDNAGVSTHVCSPRCVW